MRNLWDSQTLCAVARPPPLVNSELSPKSDSILLKPFAFTINPPLSVLKTVPPARQDEP